MEHILSIPKLITKCAQNSEEHVYIYIYLYNINSSLILIPDPLLIFMIRYIWLMILSNSQGRHGTARAPSCRNPNSSAASSRRFRNKGWERQLKETTNLLGGFSSHTAMTTKWPSFTSFGTMSLERNGLLFLEHDMLLWSTCTALFTAVFLFMAMFLFCFFSFLLVFFPPFLGH